MDLGLRPGRPGRPPDRRPGRGEVVFQPNVTLAHAVVFSAFDFSANRHKIVTDAMHFPSILYLIDEQRKYSAEVDVVPSGDGITVDTERLIDHIDERTAIVNISHILFKSAYIHDIAAIAAKARRVGAMTVIDGYQAVGTIPVDVRALGIDVYIGGCLKWLCGGPGAAFLWVDLAIRGRLEPKLTGWMAHSGRLPSRPSWSAATTPGGCCTERPASPLFMQRSQGWKSINEVGIDAIREKSQRQTERLLELADREGIRCTTPRDPRAARGTVAINIENAYEISQSLKALDILCDYRPGRASGSHLISTTSTLSSTPPSRRSAKSGRAAPGGHSLPAKSAVT